MRWVIPRVTSPRKSMTSWPKNGVGSGDWPKNHAVLADEIRQEGSFSSNAMEECIRKAEAVGWAQQWQKLRVQAFEEKAWDGHSCVSP